jgi:hypothetical protein
VRCASGGSPGSSRRRFGVRRFGSSRQRAAVAGSRARIEPSRGVVGREGFEPSKALPSDLQSDPFGRSGTSPVPVTHARAARRTPSEQVNLPALDGAAPGVRRTPSQMHLGAGAVFAESLTRRGSPAPDVHLVTWIAMEQTARRAASLTSTVGSRPALTGASGGTRTPDRLITNQVLYQLSYTGVSRPRSDVSSCQLTGPGPGFPDTPGGEGSEKGTDSRPRVKGSGAVSRISRRGPSRRV